MAQQPHIGIPDRVVPMKVIVCGVNRTGTLSMRSALWQLGLHDCYHMQPLLRNLDTHPQQWIRAFEAKYAGKGSFDKADWDHLLGHSQTCCDMPSAVFSAELAAIYPEAKVVILNRDPEQWYESCLHSMQNIVNPPLADRIVRLYCYVFDGQMRSWMRFLGTIGRLCRPYDHAKKNDKALAWFKNQYQEFRERIPAERCIEYRIQDGWKPLCEHLGVPVPMVKDETDKLVEAPFPRTNDREAFAINWKRTTKRSVMRAHNNLFGLLGKVAFTGAMGYGGWLAWKATTGFRDTFR